MGKIETNLRDDKKVLSKFMVVGLLFVFLLFVALYYITYHYLYRDAFFLDVENTIINNIFGTGRFSAFPFLDVSIFHFLILNILFFCIVNKFCRNGLNTTFFTILNVLDALYIFSIVFLYLLRWAEQNFQKRGEYLTGFERYMIPAAGIMYLFWGYEALVAFIRKKQQ